MKKKTSVKAKLDAIFRNNDNLLFTQYSGPKNTWSLSCLYISKDGKMAALVGLGNAGRTSGNTSHLASHPSPWQTLETTLYLNHQFFYADSDCTSGPPLHPPTLKEVKKYYNANPPSFWSGKELF